MNEMIKPMGAFTQEEIEDSSIEQIIEEGMLPEIEEGVVTEEMEEAAEVLSIGGKRPPRASIKIQNVGETCRYTFTLKVERTRTDIAKGILGAKFNEGFNEGLKRVADENPSLYYNELTKILLWKYEALTEYDPEQEISFTISYFGEVDETIIFGAKTFFKYAMGGYGKTHVRIRGERNKARACCGERPIIEEECCECQVVTERIRFNRCDELQETEITLELPSDGHELRLELNLDQVCLSKDIVIGLELFEVKGRYCLERRAFKVIQLGRERLRDGCGDRMCACTSFYIPAREKCIDYPIRFVVKAKAHYYYPNSTDPGCECRGCRR